MPMPYLTEPEFKNVVAVPAMEVLPVVQAFAKAVQPVVANIPLNNNTIYTLRENDDGSKVRFEAANGANVLCIAFQKQSEELEIVDLKAGKGRRTVLSADGEKVTFTGEMVRRKVGAEFEGKALPENIGAEKAAVEIEKIKTLIAVAEQHIR